MKILVTGGAGYIGSITVKYLLQDKNEVVVIDNLSNGNKKAIDCPIIVEDLENKTRVFSALKKYRFDAVIHLASYALTEESLNNPYKYFNSNIQGCLNILELMRERNIPYIIYSSSCSVYGTPKKLPIKETDPCKPESVYGETKLILENIISWYAKIYGIKYVNLRYFNAAGASIDKNLGERHNPETHLIPSIIKSILEKKDFYIFGKNHQTTDGTCNRDYIHIEDLAQANLLALKRIASGGKSDTFNIGSGTGHSNRQIVKMVEKISGQKLNVKYKTARAGDPPNIRADISKANKELGFFPKHSNLKTIINTAYNWHLL